MHYEIRICLLLFSSSYDFAIGRPQDALDFSTASFIVTITEEGSEAPNNAVPATMTFEPEKKRKFYQIGKNRFD